jgi:hypothetical protein
LPAIVDHLAVSSERLAMVEHLLASPRETEAWELFRSGSQALLSAIDMYSAQAPDLASNWLDEAIENILQATQIYRGEPGFWFQLGLA